MKSLISAILLFTFAIFFIAIGGCNGEAPANVTADGHKIIKTKTVWKVYVKTGSHTFCDYITEDNGCIDSITKPLEKMYIHFSSCDPWCFEGNLVKVYDEKFSVYYIFPAHIVLRTEKAKMYLIEKEVLKKQITSVTVQEWVDAK